MGEGTGPKPPEGFAPIASTAGFLVANGPIYERVLEDGTLQRCFFVERRHTNGLRLVHGGMVATFLDGVLGRAVSRETGVDSVTVNLSVDFLRMARAGDWITGESRLLRASRDLAFVEGRAFVGGADIARASGIFKLFRR